MKNSVDPIPPQHTGVETNFTQERKLADVPSAHTAFKKAVERMVNVNNWHEYAGAGSSKFTLCNNLGDVIEGFANDGLYIAIDLPGPGSDAGDGLEWVTIEDLQTAGDENSAEEYLCFTARPAPDPRGSDIKIAHFFTDEATSTFIVRRDGLTISAGVHGRNELPNNSDVDLHDKIRNTVIANTARIGLSGGQWQRLVNGIVA